MKYAKASPEVVLFDNSDVVTASAMGQDQWNQEELDKDPEFECDGKFQHVDKGF